MIVLVGGSGFIGDVWIGLTKLEDYTEDYKWSDGITGSYRAWATGEPFEENVRHCVYMDTRSMGGASIKGSSIVSSYAWKSDSLQMWIWTHDGFSQVQ